MDHGTSRRRERGRASEARAREVPAAAAWPAVVAALALFAAYAPALSAGFVWDDDGHLTRPGLRGLAGLARIWTDPSATQQYYPLLHSWFWLQDAVFGRSPAAHHVVNVGLHGLFAWLVWRLGARLGVRGAGWVAALFALHPIHVESVAWVSEQKNTLSGCFYAGAWLAWLRYERAREARWRPWLASFALAVAAALSKSVTASLAPAILLVTWWRDGGFGWVRRIPALLPHLAVGAALGLHTAHLEVAVGGADGGLAPPERLVVAGKDLWFYLAKVLVPAQQCFVYPRWEIEAGAALAAPALFAALLAATFALRRRLGRSPFAALAYFAGTLTPALGFFDVIPFRFSFVADHFAYLASLGPLALAVGAAHAVAQRRAVRPANLRAALAVVCALGALATWRHARAFESEERLWRDTVAKNPGAWMAYENLLQLLNGAGRHDEALALAVEALRHHPGRPGVALQEGIALQRAGRAAEALARFERHGALEPGSLHGPFNAGSALLDLGRPSEALVALDEALRREPTAGVAHMLRGNALLALARHAEALGAYARARELAPDVAAVWFNSGVGFSAVGDAARAAEAYSEALQRDAGYHGARFNRALLWMTTGRLEQARLELLRVQREAPGTELAARVRRVLEETSGR